MRDPFLSLIHIFPLYSRRSFKPLSVSQIQDPRPFLTDRTSISYCAKTSWYLSFIFTLPQKPHRFSVQLCGCHFTAFTDYVKRAMIMRKIFGQNICKKKVPLSIQGDCTLTMLLILSSMSKTRRWHVWRLFNDCFRTYLLLFPAVFPLHVVKLAF